MRVSTGETDRTLGGDATRVSSRLSVGQARIAAILAGGAIGTLARAGLAEALPHRAGQWPWATFIVNLAGAFILGWLLTRLAERNAPSRHWRFFAGTGICGLLLGKNFLDYSVFSSNAPHGREIGIFLVEAGVLITVSGTMTALFYAFSERGR